MNLDEKIEEESKELGIPEEKALADVHEKVHGHSITYRLPQGPYQIPDPVGTAKKRKNAVKNLIKTLYKNPKFKKTLDKNLRNICLREWVRNRSNIGLYSKDRDIKLDKGMLVGANDELFTLGFLHELGHAITKNEKSEIKANLAAIELIGIDQYKSLVDKGIGKMDEKFSNNIRKAIRVYESGEIRPKIKLSKAKQTQIWNVYNHGLKKD